MKIDNVDFADGFVEKFKTEKEFMEEMSGAGYSHVFYGPKRQERLKEAYALHHPKKEKTESIK